MPTYVTRVGSKAGTVHRTRQGPNDLEIVPPPGLVPAYFYYLLLSRQDELRARARGATMLYITRRDVRDVLAGEPYNDPERDEHG
jgi:hypothetical protein